jgi:hypothetical protein
MVRLGLGLENVRSWQVGRKSGGGIRRRLSSGGGGRGAEGGGGAARLLLKRLRSGGLRPAQLPNLAKNQA